MSAGRPEAFLITRRDGVSLCESDSAASRDLRGRPILQRLSITAASEGPGCHAYVVSDEPTLRTDAELQQLTVGDLQPHDAVIALVDYDEAWPRVFEQEARRIRDALGNAAIAIEHVGSTSVPGLAAKPIIDIVLAVADSADEGAYAPALARAGYRLRVREPAWHEHRMFKGFHPDANVHVFSAGEAEIERMLALRDRLRGHADDRERYAQVKRRLARRRWRHVQHYADAKSGVIEEILSGTG